MADAPQENCVLSQSLNDDNNATKIRSQRDSEINLNAAFGKSRSAGNSSDVQKPEINEDVKMNQSPPVSCRSGSKKFLSLQEERTLENVAVDANLHYTAERTELSDNAENPTGVDSLHPLTTPETSFKVKTISAYISYKSTMPQTATFERHDCQSNSSKMEANPTNITNYTTALSDQPLGEYINPTLEDETSSSEDIIDVVTVSLSPGKTLSLITPLSPSARDNRVVKHSELEKAFVPSSSACTPGYHGPEHSSPYHSRYNEKVLLPSALNHNSMSLNSNQIIEQRNDTVQNKFSQSHGSFDSESREQDEPLDLSTCQQEVDDKWLHYRTLPKYPPVSLAVDTPERSDRVMIRADPYDDSVPSLPAASILPPPRHFSPYHRSTTEQDVPYSASNRVSLYSNKIVDQRDESVQNIFLRSHVSFDRGSFEQEPLNLSTSKLEVDDKRIHYPALPINPSALLDIQQATQNDRVMLHSDTRNEACSKILSGKYLAPRYFPLYHSPPSEQLVPHSVSNYDYPVSLHSNQNMGHVTEQNDFSKPHMPFGQPVKYHGLTTSSLLKKKGILPLPSVDPSGLREASASCYPAANNYPGLQPITGHTAQCWSPNLIHPLSVLSDHTYAKRYDIVQNYGSTLPSTVSNLQDPLWKTGMLMPIDGAEGKRMRYVCRWKGCFENYEDESSYEKHVKKHMQAHFKCMTCLVVFQNKSCYNQHINTKGHKAKVERLRCQLTKTRKESM